MTHQYEVTAVRNARTETVVVDFEPWPQAMIDSGLYNRRRLITAIEQALKAVRMSPRDGDMWAMQIRYLGDGPAPVLNKPVVGSLTPKVFGWVIRK